MFIVMIVKVVLSICTYIRTKQNQGRPIRVRSWTYRADWTNQTIIRVAKLPNGPNIPQGYSEKAEIEKVIKWMEEGRNTSLGMTTEESKTEVVHKDFGFKNY